MKRSKKSKKTNDGSKIDGDGYQSPEANGLPNIAYWVSQLEAAQNAAKQHWQASKEAWTEYLGYFSTQPTLKGAIRQPENRYPLYWSSVKTVQPALYSRTPVCVAEKMLDNLDDNIARICALALERLAKYLMHSISFDRVQYSTRDTYIHTGKTTNRVCFDSEVSETPKKVYYTETQGADDQGNPMPQWVNAEGEILADGIKLTQDDEGNFYVEEAEEALESVCVDLVPLSYDDIIHTPNARHWSEIDWIGYRSFLTREDAAERFGDEIAAAIPYTSHLKDSGDDKSKELPVQYAEIWEIWDKRRKQVYWHAKNYNQEFLDIQDDPYGLDGFFPSPPFMLGTVGPDNLYPVPDYIQLRPLILQMHAMAKRLQNLIRSARRRFVYDQSIKELKSLASDTAEGEGVGVPAFQQQIVGKGGIEQVMQWLPLQPIVDAITQMSQVMDMYEAKFNDLYGIPDIMRGASDPNETAAAQQLKGKYNSLRFSTVQREFQRLVRDDIELMTDLAIDKFPQEKIEEIVGVRFFDADDQAAWPECFLLLKDDDERKIRLDIETDSTITMNLDAEMEQRSYLGKSLVDGIQALANVQQIMPDMTPVAAETLLFVVQGMRNGKQIEGRLNKAIEQIVNPPPTPPGPPPPDYELLKIQTQNAQVQANHWRDQGDAMVEQGKLNLQSQQMMADLRLKMSELQLKAQELRLEAAKLNQTGQIQTQKIATDAQVKTQNAALDAQVQGSKIAQDGQTNMVGAQIEGQKVAHEAGHKDARLALEAKAQGFDQTMQALALQLEQYKVKLDEQEKYMTEARLQHEAQMEQQKMALEPLAGIEAAKAAPQVSINVNPSQPAPILAQPRTDMMGIPIRRPFDKNPLDVLGGNGGPPIL